MNTNRKAIKNLTVGDTFHLSNDTVYVVTRPVRTGGGRTAVTYKVEGTGAEFEFVRPSLTDAYMVD